jgi:hypothetical protein
VSVETAKCETCGTTVMKFDPPIAIHAEEACGAVPHMNFAAATESQTIQYSAGKVSSWHVEGVSFVSCILEKGHDGEHMDMVDTRYRWSA